MLEAFSFHQDEQQALSLGSTASRLINPFAVFNFHHDLTALVYTVMVLGGHGVDAFGAYKALELFDGVSECNAKLGGAGLCCSHGGSHSLIRNQQRIPSGRTKQ